LRTRAEHAPVVGTGVIARTAVTYQPMDILLLVVDSLRADSLCATSADRPNTPFLRALCRRTLNFCRAYAAECWTLPSHCSMFTGLLPSEHGAHFQTMGYFKAAPTIAELFRDAGYHTEIVTRNFVFDNTFPGITRGFQQNTRLLSTFGTWHPFALLLALTKPRNRRILRSAGFFHPRQHASREFLNTFTRTLMPADHLSLEHVLARMQRLRKDGKQSFIFCNLYDVHWPYPPTDQSVLRPWSSATGIAENLFLLPFVLPRVASHGYLRARFRLSQRSRKRLRARYHRAIELMDQKLAAFCAAATAAGLLDDTLLIVTSDHGEASGEHGLYLHDASVYNTHLHVPLWVQHPDRTPEVIHDVVTTRDLFGLMQAAAVGPGVSGTILDAGYRAAHPLAVAEHFHYPHVRDALPRYRLDLTAAIGRMDKVIVRGGGVEHYAVSDDPGELTPTGADLRDFEARMHMDGVPASVQSQLVSHLRRWQGSLGAS